MTVQLISIRTARGESPLGRFDEIERRARDLTPRHDQLIETMRRGAGSVGAQLQAQAWHSPSGAIVPWVKTKPFGTRPQPLRTLLSTGRYRTALDSGGSGAVEVREPLRFGIGLDPSEFPQWPVFQKRDGPTVIRAKSSHRTRSGRLAMQVFLGLAFKVWLSERKLLVEGLVVHPRRVDINPVMKRRVVEEIRAYFLSGPGGRGGARPHRLPESLRRAA